jgi:pilus assembly protein Flp/PilA
MTLFNRFLKDESGATAIEYALIAAIIGIGLITALGPLRDNITDLFNTIGGGLTNAGT